MFRSPPRSETGPGQWVGGYSKLFGWLKLSLPAPPLMGFVGLLGILLGSWSIEQFKPMPRREAA